MLARSNLMRLITDIPYATEVHARLNGDLYLPEPVTPHTPIALVIHGGGWSNSDKTSLAPVCELLTQNGIAALSVNYRRLPEAPWPACFEDCVTAFDALRDPAFIATYGLHPQPLFVVGASAGGHLALMTALTRPVGQVAAILAIAPPVSLRVNAPSCDTYLFTPAFFEAFFGHDRPVNDTQLREVSPLSYVGQESPPLWLVHSRNDMLVPPLHSRELADAYRAFGRPVSEHEFDGTDHVHGLWRDNNAVHRQMTPECATALTTAVQAARPLL